MLWQSTEFVKFFISIVQCLATDGRQNVLCWVTEDTIRSVTLFISDPTYRR
jgi:hypothetical protein